MDETSKLKFATIEYYEQIKHAIDIRSQSILMDKNIGSEVKEKVLNRAEEFVKKCDEIFNSIITQLNRTPPVKNLPIDSERQESQFLADCFYIKDSAQMFESPLGGLIVVDWCLSENEKKFIEHILVENKKPLVQNRQANAQKELQLNLTENLVLLKSAFLKNLDPIKQHHLNDIIVIRTNSIRREVNELQDFKLTGFSFQSIDKSFSLSFKNLAILDLSHNKIKIIRSSTFKCNLKNLEKLFLIECDLSEIEINAFVGLNSLQELDLGGNENIDLNSPDQLNGLDNLKKLNLTDDNFKSDINNLLIFKNLTKLTDLELAINDLRNRITELTFTGLSNLEKLDLSHCMITNIEPSSFIHVTNLKTLNLGYNHLRKLTPEIFSGLKKLIELELQECSIEEIVPGSFADLSELKILGIAANNIEGLNKNSLKGLKNLEDLFVDYRPDVDINAFEDLACLKFLNFGYKTEMRPLGNQDEISRMFNLNPNVLIEYLEV